MSGSIPTPHPTDIPSYDTLGKSIKLTFLRKDILVAAFLYRYCLDTYEILSDTFKNSVF